MSGADTSIQLTIEAALLAAGRPLSVDQLCDLFIDQRQDEERSKKERRALRQPVRKALKNLVDACMDRGVELIEVASGFRYQVRTQQAPHVAHLWAERPARTSKALLETLALIAYRQPITRGDIEKVRGVSVSSHIVKNLLEYNWIRIVGHRNTPGHPRLYGTTSAFLDHFGLKSLQDLPPLAELYEQGLAEEKALQEESGEHDLEALSEALAEKPPIEQRLPEQAAEKNVIVAEPAPLVLGKGQQAKS